MPKGKFTRAKEVNPSLYVGNTAWMQRQIPRIRTADKRDGFPKERLMQSLISIAHEEKVPIGRVHLEDHEQFHGINTLAELRQARQIYERRRENAYIAA